MARSRSTAPLQDVVTSNGGADERILRRPLWFIAVCVHAAQEEAERHHCFVKALEI